MTRQELASCEVGDRVTYNPGYGEPEKGLIKSIDGDSKHAFVVYNCAGNWDKFKDYTAARTRVEDLELGWN